MMMQRTLTEQDGMLVLSIHGYLAEAEAERAAGGLDWAAARSAHTIVLDFTGVLGWTPGGQSILGAAVREVLSQGRDVECRLLQSDRDALTDPVLQSLPCQPNATATAALASPGRIRLTRDLRRRQRRQ